MTEHQLAVQARFRPETVERILRVVRHRGFRLLAMHVQTQNDNLNIELTVASLRPVELLFSQLIRLADVIDIEMQQLAAQQFATTLFTSKQIRA